MLTYPSDPLPQIVCPMDEDAIPPNRFCSAPPHSEPPPPLLPLPSITPSCVNDGISGHRRSGRFQGIRGQAPKKQSTTDTGAAQKPSRQNPSPTKRQRESRNMVQASQPKQPRAESTHGQEKQNEDEFDFSFAAGRQNIQKDQKSPQKKTNVSAAENVAEQFSDNTTQNLDTTKSDMVTCMGLADGHAIENASVPKGWVIGPLFQSFKSKMASFTEIVMSPVKLFKANSPPQSTDHPDKLDECVLQADGMSDAEHSEPSDMFHAEAQSENGNQGAEANQQRLSEEGAQNAKIAGIKYSKKLSFELSTHSSEQAYECAITKTEENVPDSEDSSLPCIVYEDVSESVGSVFRSSILLQPSVNVSASHESKLKTSSTVEEQEGKQAARLKPLPRKYTGNKRKVTSKTFTSEVKMEESNPELIDEQLSQITLVELNKVDLSDMNSMLLLSSSVCQPAQPETDCPQHGDDCKKIESCHLVHQSLQNNLNDSTNRRTLKPNLDTQQLECQPDSETYSATGLRRAKTELKLDCHSQDLKRKRLTVDICTKQTKKPPRKDIFLTDIIENEKEMLKSARKGPAVLTRATKKGKTGQQMLATINETMLNTQTESSSNAMSVCSLDKSTGVSVDSSNKVKPSGSCKRLKTRTGLGKPDVNSDNSMDLETTIAVTSTKQADQTPLSEVFVCPDIKQLQSTRQCRNNKKPLKRKSPNQAISTTGADSTLVSTSSELSTEPLEVTTTDFNISQHLQKEERGKTGLNQPPKRPKRGFRGAVKSSVPDGSQETKQCTPDLPLITKENQSEESKGKISVDPVYFEMIPFESQHGPSPSGLPLDRSVLLNNIDRKEKGTSSVADEIFPSDAEATSHNSIGVSMLRSSARRVKSKPRRADNQRRKCRVLHRMTRKGEEVSNSVTMDDTDLATAGTHSSENGLSRQLLRSYSCPEIPSLHSQHHSRSHTPHQHQSSHTSFVHHTHKSLHRARRHTVCSIEVEREIAPLCLRKEVYPSRRSLPYDGITQSLSPSLAPSPSTSLSALASCFLSSPLAFLSKKVDSRGAVASPSTSSHVPSPTSSSSVYPRSPTWRLSAFLQRSDSSSASMDSSRSGIPLECEIGRRQQSEEEDDGENTSSSSQEFEDVGLREEKALSDSEIKVVQKHEQRGKVSSIRIRKTLPKPQNNLTPMGLPKPIRPKKKEFSLEEIYTNKNFSKPPESRLETIFEVPLNRRNGSESWFGQRRVKRFLEFLEVGEVRKPKKPLVGVGKAGISSSRTRRGGFPKDEPSLSVQDVDSLLCAKLDQLNLWLIRDQKDS
ncbi:uncharacterized protein prr14 isoform X1 [Larimichthys crocea]|nr:uncharacterized protein LOC104930233 isoform X1 [Larimichthys crocea]XP_019130668.1 uncharacterized protein LOC104930233 isoform X1 [Larimichthys crocea]